MDRLGLGELQLLLYLFIGLIVLSSLDLRCWS